MLYLKGRTAFFSYLCIDVELILFQSFKREQEIFCIILRSIRIMMGLKIEVK